MTELESAFINTWRSLFGKTCEPIIDNAVFFPNREWRFDFCWKDARVAVEMEGGVSGGKKKSRHTTAEGFQEDTTKYNSATATGWRVLRFTAKDMKARPVQCCEMVKALIDGKQSPFGAAVTAYAAKERRKKNGS